MNKTALIVALEDELFDLFDKEDERYDIHFCGVGKVNAATKATELIYHGYDRIINYGSAGSPIESFKHKLFNPSRFIQLDMDCTALGFLEYCTPFENTKRELHVHEHNYSDLICATSDQFQTKMDPMFQLYDMEAYAIAKVCHRFDREFACFKYVSDSGEANDWEENFHLGAQLFKDKLENDILI